MHSIVSVTLYDTDSVTLSVTLGVPLRAILGVAHSETHSVKALFAFCCITEAYLNRLRMFTLVESTRSSFG